MKKGRIHTKDKYLLTGSIVLGLIILVGIGYYVYTGYYAYPAAPTAQVIKIGHIGPLTGYAAMYGEQEVQGIDLAVEEINSKGGIRGKQLMVIHEDDRLESTLAVNAFNKLITVDKVPAVIGEISSSGTLAIAPIAEKNKVVLISHLAASKKLSNAGDYIFKIDVTPAQEAEKLVEIASSLNLTDCAILYMNSDYGTDLAQSIEEEFTKNKGNIIISEGYNGDTIDFRTQLTKIQAKNPSVIFLIGWPNDMAMVLRQARELGISSQFIAADTFNEPKIVEWSGNASEGVIFPCLANGDAAIWQQFNDKFKSRYGKDAPLTALMAYDATNVLAAAMENGFTGDEIKAGLYLLKDYPGVSGNITFDKNGDVVSRTLVFKIVKEGKFQDYK